MIQALHFREVIKRYGRQSVLNGIDLEIAEGEFFGLVGVNGAGKTTLIKSMLDFCGVDGGGIRIFGQPHNVASSRASLAYLPERFVPPHYATGRDFLSFIGELHGRRAGPDELAEVLAALDLQIEALKKPVGALSKGMAQKLGLAATLLSGRRMFVLDEPMTGLDPKARALLKSHLLTRKAAGLTLFCSTHLLSDAEALCDRIGILHAGQLRFVGTTAECCERFDSDNLEQAYLRCVEDPTRLNRQSRTA